MPTAFEQLRDAIATKMNAVPNIGVVQSRERLAADYDTFLALFKDSASGEIRGWTITWGDNRNVMDEYAGFGQMAWQYEFVIRGYLGFNDANNTEDQFGVLVEAVRDSLQQSRTFGVASVVPFSTEVSVDHHEKRWFGSVLCHFAEVTVNVCMVENMVWA